MFNKLYKSANEKFSSDAARDRFLASLDQPAARKKKNIRPIITSAAALAACFAVTVFGINLYNNRPDVPERIAVPSISATPDSGADVSGASAELPGTPALAAEQKAETNSPANIYRVQPPAKEHSKAVQSKETAQSAESAPAAESAAAEQPEASAGAIIAAESANTSATAESEESAVPEMYSMSVCDSAETENAATDSAALNNAADESAPNTERFAAKSAIAAERTLADYNSFIGRDIRDGICIPDGMTDMTPLTDSAGDGWVYVYDGNGKHVQIRTAPSAQVCANSAAQAPDEPLRFSDRGIDFEITAEGFSGEELDALVSSLKK